MNNSSQLKLANTCLGYQAGSNYTTSESSNICIGHDTNGTGFIEPPAGFTIDPNAEEVCKGMIEYHKNEINKWTCELNDLPNKETRLRTKIVLHRVLLSELERSSFFKNSN